MKPLLYVYRVLLTGIHLMRTGQVEANLVRLSWMPGDRGLAVPDNAHARALLVDLTSLHPATSHPIVLPSNYRRMTSIAVSPDGQWAASGGWKEPGIQVWNLATRCLERVLPPSDGQGDTQFYVTFSPDGRWLVCSAANNEAGGYYFWRVGTWERESFIPTGAVWAPQAVFSRDGSMMALRMSPQQIRLADPTDGRTIVHVSTLQPVVAGPCAFSPDGSKLVALSNKRTFLVWDLRRIRERLAAMDLDWDQPSPEEKAWTTKGTPAPPLKVQVIGRIPEPPDYWWMKWISRAQAGQ